jgi:hypothetical protein
MQLQTTEKGKAQEEEIHIPYSDNETKILNVSAYLQLREILSGEELHKSRNHSRLDNFFNRGTPL